MKGREVYSPAEYPRQIQPIGPCAVEGDVVAGVGVAHDACGRVVPEDALDAAVGGLAFGALFLLTGSLIPGIILHALIDLQVAYVLRPAPAVTDLEAQAACPAAARRIARPGRRAVETAGQQA